MHVRISVKKDTESYEKSLDIFCGIISPNVRGLRGVNNSISFLFRFLELSFSIALPVASSTRFPALAIFGCSTEGTV